MRKSIKTTFALILSASIITTAARAQDTCWRTVEVDAAKVRNMQSMLMIAALECSRDGYGQDHLYDEFVRNNRSALVGFNDVIKMYYTRAYGPAGGRSAYDHFTTALANRHATRASENGDFCRGTDTVLRLALNARPDELVSLASDVEERPFGVGETCEEATRAPAPPIVEAPVSVAAWRPQNGYVETPYADQPAAASDPASPSLPDRYQADERQEGPPAPALHAEDASAGTPINDEPTYVPLPAPSPALAMRIDPPIVPAARAPLAPADIAPEPVAGAVPVAPEPAVVAVASAPLAIQTRAAAIAPAAGPSPAAALAAAAQALQAAAEALRASTIEAPADAAPVIRERVPARKL